MNYGIDNIYRLHRKAMKMVDELLPVQ
jgi:hypothetical protein